MEYYYSSLYLFLFKRLLFLSLLVCFYGITKINTSTSMQPPQCHEDESSALLQFKHSFTIKRFASTNPFAFPKVESWKLEGEHNNSSDCCSWYGVECDETTSHVIGLDLSSSFLYGSINSNSSLFHLVHLQKLNLADNDFNYSQIPSGIGNLSRLTTLNLSSAFFFGQIPSEISETSNLESLDLSSSLDSSSSHSLLKLENPSLKSLVQNLTNLKELYLTNVNVSSLVPDILANMSSLTGLVLEDCGLYGEFPRGIFLLPKLEYLSVNHNVNLTGHLPEFHPSSSPLKELSLGSTSFSGNLPRSMGNLESLTHLDFSQCHFFGTLPASLGNLTQLTVLDLRRNNFSGQIPSSLANLPQLTSLALGYNNFNPGKLSLALGLLPKLSTLYLEAMNLQGEIPLSLSNLTQLSYLYLRANQLGNQIPSFLTNLTHLNYIDLQGNQLQGPIPNSFNQLKSLEIISLAYNNLSGTLELDDVFLMLQNLSWFDISGNKLTVVTRNNTNATTLPKFHMLNMRECNLKEFPHFMQFQDELSIVNLAGNGIHGQIPTWVWNSSQETMMSFTASFNFLTGFDQHPTLIPWRSISFLELSSNRLQGSLPIPPKSTIFYNVSGNMLGGEIPPSICQNSFLQALDLSNNFLSGTIPQCLVSLTGSLLLLNVSGNSFQGTIPEMFTSGNKLKMIDVSQNQLQGKVPRSLANCTNLEFLVLGNNKIEDTFPTWLGVLPNLQVLILRQNKFHGGIENPNTILEFPKLRIIDLSDNGFSGNLPSKYFQKWKAMKMVHAGKLAYMEVSITFIGLNNIQLAKVYSYSMIIDNKGNRMVYEKIQSAFVAIDMSNNKFGGEIPESIRELTGIQLLNLSNNELIGQIPSSLGSLTNLESLDLSQNMLSGKIPLQLTQLTFLAVLDVSHNHLAGPIPRGAQFDTFQNNSYEGNSKLCGDPLSKKCENAEASPPPPPSTFQQENDSEFPSKIDWIVITLGYGSGLVVGLIIGQRLTTRYHEWFIKTFGRRQKRRIKQNKRGQRGRRG